MDNSASIANAGPIAEKKSQPLIVEMVVRLVREKPLGLIGGIIVIIFLLVGIFADFLAPYGFNEIILADRLSPPSATHILGADNLGRDLLSRVIYGARISMYVGLAVATISSLINVTIGAISGYFGGKIDLVMQRFIDAIMCFPGIVIMLTIISILGPGLLQVIITLGIFHGIGGRTRVIRSAVISMKESVYVEASRAIGARHPRIILKHILPNIMPVVIVAYTTELGTAILIESTLSFLGYGIPPPTPSWGGMLSGSGRQYMLLAPWMCLWPGLALAVVVYGINMLGDALRDILDPRLRGGLGRYSGVKRRRPKAAVAQEQEQEQAQA